MGPDARFPSVTHGYPALGHLSEMVGDGAVNRNQTKVWRGPARSFWTPSRDDTFFEVEEKVKGHVLLGDWSDLDSSPRLTRLTWEGRTTLAVGVGPGETGVYWEINGPQDAYFLISAGVRSIPPLDLQMGIGFADDVPRTQLETVQPAIAYTWPQTPPLANLTLTLNSGGVRPTETTGGSFFAPRRPLLWALDQHYGSPPLFAQVFSFPAITVETTLIFDLVALLPRLDWREDARLNPYL